MHSTLHGTIKIAGSPAGIFHFNLPAEQNGEKLNAQKQWVMHCCDICLAL